MISSPTRPVMRYPGGKWKIAPWIIEHMPQHQVYVEVFGGAASVLIRKAPSRTEVYNDVESRVVNVFRVLRDPEKAAELIRLLDLTPFSSEEYAESYLEEPVNDVDAARLMIFRSYAGIGSDSVYRNNGFRRGFKNKKLDANHALASYLDCLPGFVERMREVIIENLDWEKLIDIYDAKETLFYVDPPYLDETLTSNSVVYSHPFTKNQHIDLGERLQSIKGNAIVSGYQSDLYNDLFRGWMADAKTAIAGSGSKRTETIWIKHPENRLF